MPPLTAGVLGEMTSNGPFQHKAFCDSVLSLKLLDLNDLRNLRLLSAGTQINTVLKGDSICCLVQKTGKRHRKKERAITKYLGVKSLLFLQQTGYSVTSCLDYHQK